MKRIKFAKGKQRKFLLEVLEKINCPSLRELRKRGFDVSYSSLKNYFSERRNLPGDFFMDLIEISKIDEKNINFEILDENFGQILGGRNSKR